MLKIMDIPDLGGRGTFWEAYRACAYGKTLSKKDTFVKI